MGIGGRGETDAGHNPDSIDISDVLVFNRILSTDEINFITSTLSKPKPCPALKCTIHCDTGYVTDANGCETCECQPQVYVQSTGICAPHHAPGTGLADWANKDLDTCKSMCDNDSSCTSFHYHNLSGPNHHVQHRCIFKSTSRGCTEQEQQEAEQLYRDLGLDCCLDKSCIDNQVIPGAINWSYQYGWHCT